MPLITEIVAVAAIVASPQPAVMEPAVTAHVELAPRTGLPASTSMVYEQFPEIKAKPEAYP